MPYLPNDTVEHTEFPKAWSKDVFMQMRLINDLWRRKYPELPYECIKVDPQLPTPPAVEPDPDQPIAGPDATAFDALWNESVPESMLATGWEQPHLSATVPDSGTHVAANPEKYEPSVDIHARVQTREELDLELHHYGFDRVRDLLVTIPLALLDDAGVTVKQGDKFTWDDDEYMVLQYERVGFWKNTNVRLYIALNCEHFRQGS
jgi:hypothetical protein